MRYLIDTNFISELRKGDRANRGVMAWVMSHDSALWGLSVMTIGEIRKGIEDLRRRDVPQANVIEEWLNTIHEDFSDQILPISVNIADRWGHLMSSNKLPPSDMLLAATAIEHDLTVITRNTADFEGSGARFHNPWK